MGIALSAFMCANRIEAGTPCLDFGVVDEPTYQSLLQAIEKTEYTRYDYSQAPKPRVVGAVAGLLAFATKNPLADDVQLAAFVSTLDAELENFFLDGALTPVDPDLDRGANFLAAARFSTPLVGDPELVGTDTNVGEEMLELLAIEIPEPDRYVDYQRRMVEFDRARIRQFENSDEWASLLVIGFSGQDLLGMPNEHLAGALEAYLIGQGYDTGGVPCAPSIIGSVDTADSAISIAIRGSHAFVTDGNTGLLVIDISDPMMPSIVTTLDTPSYAEGIAISGSLALVGDAFSGLQVIDISVPTMPTIIGSWNTPGYSRGVAVSGDFAYVADGTAGVRIIDISDPTNPSEVADIPSGNEAFDVAIQGTLAYVADGTAGLQIIDITNPNSPVVEGDVATPTTAYDVAVGGHFAYVADSAAGLQVINITDPELPTIVAAEDTPNLARGLTLRGSTAFVADWSSGLQAIDVTDPYNPITIGFVDTPGNAVTAAMSGTLAFVTDLGSGLQVIETEGCVDPVASGLRDLPPNFASYQSALAQPLATSPLWAEISDDLASVNQESQARLAELTDAMADEDDLVQSVTNAADPAFVAALDAELNAQLDMVADERARTSANAILLFQSSDLDVQALATKTRDFSGLSLDQNNTMAKLSGSSKVLGGLAQGFFEFSKGKGKRDPVKLAGFAADTVTSALGLGSLFGTDGPSEQDQIFNQMTAMRGQMEDVRVEVNQRFNRIEGALNTIYTSLVGEIDSAFEELGDNIGELKTAVENNGALLDTINRDVLTTHAKLELIEDQLWAMAGVLLQAGFADVFDDALDFRDDNAPSNDLPMTIEATNFASAEIAIAGFATSDAKGVPLAGPLATPIDETNAAALLGGATTNDGIDSIGRKINDLRDYANGVPGVSLGTSALAAPGPWGQAAAAFSQLGRESQWYFGTRPGSLQNIDDVIAVGNIFVNATVDARSDALFDHLFDGWRASLAPITDLFLQDFAIEPSIIGSVDMLGTALDVKVSGTRAYVANGFFGLQIIDIANPAKPVIIGNLATQEDAWGVAIRGDLAYIAQDGLTSNGSRLDVINISDSTAPYVVGSVTLPGRVRRVAIDGSYAYVAGISGTGLQIIDINDPTMPSVVGSLPSLFAEDVAVQGTLACVAEGAGGLKIIDVSNPSLPVQRGAISTGGAALGVVVRGSHAYVSDFSTGLEVFDISDPTTPSPDGSRATPGTAARIALSGSYAFITDGPAGLQIIDINDPALPIVDAVDTPGAGLGGLALNGTLAYVADFTSGLQVIDIQDAAQISIVSTTADPSEGVICGQYFYALGFVGLEIYDISDFESPTKVGETSIPGFGFDIAVSGGLACVADGDMHVVDVSDPANPVVVGTAITPDTARDVVICGSLAFVLDYDFASNADMHIIDISDPTDPEILGTAFNAGSSGSGLAVKDSFVYVTRGTSLNAIDFINPAAPVSYSGNSGFPTGLTSIAIAGDYAYVMRISGGIEVINIGFPPSQNNTGTSVAFLPLQGQVGGIVISGDRAWVSSYNSAQFPLADNLLQVVDISNPLAPSIVGTVSGTPGQLNGALSPSATNGTGVIAYELGQRVIISNQALLGAWAGVASELDNASNTPLVEAQRDLDGYQALIEAFMTFATPEVLEQSSIARAVLRADAMSGELSIGPVRDVIGRYIVDPEASTELWPGEILKNLSLLEAEVDAALQTRGGHSYIEYMLADLRHLREHRTRFSVDDTYLAQSGQTLSVDAMDGVIKNDVIQEFRPICVDILWELDPMYVAPQDGQVTMNTDGSFTYTPDPGFVGTDTFTYRLMSDTIFRAPPTVIPQCPAATFEVYSAPATVVIRVEQSPTCDGDANGDFVVDVNDISYVLFRLGDACGAPGCDGDANGDGVIDVNDISYVLFRLGDPC
jgi:hypothetical protein